jgi:hypothetical protein
VPSADPFGDHPDELYPRLLGPLWAEIPPAVRQIHVDGSSAGKLEVVRGRGALAALLGFLLRLPAASPSSRVTLVVSNEAGVQKWRRRFEGTVLVSEQFAEGGRLVETYGPLVMLFDIRPIADGLELLLHRAFLRLGSLRFALPRVVGPRIRGVARAAGDAASIEVRIAAPLVGVILLYRGIVRAGATH